MKQVTKVILAYELLEKGLHKSHTAKHFDLSRRTIIRWSRAINRYGSLYDGTVAAYNYRAMGLVEKLLDNSEEEQASLTNPGELITLMNSLSSGILNESQWGLKGLTSFLSIFLTNLISIPYIFLLELN